MFIKQKDNKFRYVPANPSDSLVKGMDAGLYNVKITRSFFGQTLEFECRDGIYEKGRIIESGVFKEARKKISNFMSKEMKIARKALGLKDKLAMIFNGKQGTGKTYLAGQLATELVKEYNALGLILTEEINIGQFIDTIREQDPDRLIFIILDEFEKTFPEIKHGRVEPELLSFLDGPNSKDNVILIATSNSTHGIPATLMDRPGRFEEIYEFSIKDDEVLKGMLAGIIPDKYEGKLDTDAIFNTIKKDKVYAMDKLTILVRDAIYKYEKKPPVKKPAPKKK